MGLRINTNLPSLTALRNLSNTDARQTRNLERLSTGLRISRVQDDPLGLTLSETLRTQVRSLEQASSNTQNAGNLASVAESALAEVTDLMHDIRRSITFALNGTASEAELAAEQDFINSALASIERIAATTKFGDVKLLDGSAGFNLQSVSAAILEVRPQRVTFNPIADPTAFTLNVTTSATTASGSLGSVVGGDIVLQIDGPTGTTVLNLVSGTTATGVATAVDRVRGFTGIFSSGTNVHTEKFGTLASMRFEVIGGPGALSGLGGASVYFDRGQDVVGDFLGTTVSGIGRVLPIDNPFFTGEVEIQPGAFGAMGFQILRSGLLFQLGGETTAVNQERIGIANMTPSSLGKQVLTVGGQSSGGFLNSIAAGGQNDLFTNPTNAFRVLDLALDDVQRAREALGSFVAHIIEPTGRATDVAIENLTAAESAIRDLDFAKETADFTRNQVLFQAGISVVGQAARLPETVLQLLQSP